VKIELVAKDNDSCALNNCPAVYRVIGAPGGKVYIGKRLEEMDEGTYRQVEDAIGPGEGAFWVPDSL